MRQRLLLLIIAALLPLVVVIGALSFISVSQQRASMRDAAVGYAEQVLKSVDRELRAQIMLLQVLARSPTLEASEEGFAQFRDVASRFVDQAQDWKRVILSDLERGQIVNTGAPPDAPLPAVIDVESYKRALASNGAIVTDLTGPGALALDGLPSVALRTATPVKDPAARLVLTVLIRPEAFERAIVDAQINPTWRPFLIDGSDRVISAPRVTGATGQRAGQAAIEARKSGKNGVYSGRAWNGDPVITAFIKSPETGWSAHISIPVAEYNAPLRQSAMVIGALSMIALALFALFAYFARRELLAMRAESEALSRASRMEALGRMTGGVAHDFNNLLMVVSTGADMLRKRNLDKGAERFVFAIQHAAERGTRLTRDLATFARSRGGDVTTIEAGLRIASIKTLLRQSVTDNITLEFRIPEGQHYVAVDPVEFDLALLNIVSNARDAMPDGGQIVIAIEEAFFPNSPDRKGWRLSIADTGIGIKAEDLPHVFEPFFTTKAVGKGTGLGLSHVYGFAQAHGGVADVSSTPGKGATISIYLPKAEPPAAVQPQERSPVDETWRADGLEAIVVDDNDDVRVLTGEVLAELGFKVRYASNASEALALCEAGADLVVSDIVMPGAMDGVALGRIVRQRWPDMQIVLMTGYSEASNGAAASGMRVIQKPFTPAALLATINTGRFDHCTRRPRTNA